MSSQYGLGASLIFGLTLLLSLIGLFAQPKLIEHSLFRPYWFLRKEQYDTILMSGFVHADGAHLLFNMISFWFFAFPLEQRIGTGAFVALYVAGLLLSEVGTWFKHRNDPDYATLGASGAILAVLFASIVYFPQQRLAFMLLPIPIPAPLFAIGYLAYSYYSSKQNRGRVNHDAHFGGAITGLLFVALTDPGAYRGLLRMIVG